jgi:hypothetical protein
VTAPPVTPPPTTVAAVGWLQLAVQPWANVTVDGRPAGQTPLRIPLAPGPHRVQMEHEDYEIYPQVVMISAGETTRLRVDLTQKGVRRQRR